MLRDRGTSRPSSVRTLWPCPGLLVSPPVPPCPPDASVPPPGPRSRSPGPLSPPGPLSTARSLSSDIPGPRAPRACAVPPHQRGARRERESRRAGLQLPWCSAAAPRAPWRTWRPRRGGSGRSRLRGLGGGSGRWRSPGNTRSPADPRLSGPYFCASRVGHQTDTTVLRSWGHSSPAPSTAPHILCPRRSSLARPSRLTANTGVCGAQPEAPRS